MQRPIFVQHRRELVELFVAKAFGFYRSYGCDDVFAVCAGLTMSLLHVTQLLRQRQASGVLHVPAIDHIGERADPLPRFVLQPNRSHHFPVHRCDLLARAQVGDSCRTMLLRDPERYSSARAATIQAEHEAGFFRRSPMHKGVNAERAMFADEPCRNLFDKFEAGPPHQRAIAKHP